MYYRTLFVFIFQFLFFIGIHILGSYSFYRNKIHFLSPPVLVYFQLVINLVKGIYNWNYCIFPPPIKKAVELLYCPVS